MPWKAIGGRNNYDTFVMYLRDIYDERMVLMFFNHYSKNELDYVEKPKRYLGNIVILGIGVLAILITGFLYSAKLNSNGDLAGSSATVSVMEKTSQT